MIPVPARAFLSGFLGLLLPVSSVAGQVLHGRATLGDSSGLPGVVIELIDGRGRVAARALADERGAYRLTAAPGTYALRTLRIGFRPGNAGHVTLVPGEEIARNLRLDAVAFALDTLRIASRARCAPYDGSSATAAVWQQARAAVTAAHLTAGNPVFSAVLQRGERIVDARGRGERTLYTRRDSGFVLRGWVSISADSLARVGYVQSHADGTNSWFAPDLDVLLSDGFIRDHCFRLVREGSALGVRFEPAAHRKDVAEIRGTVWIDAASSELRRMEFEYVNVPFAETGDPGGAMEFVRLGNGGWAIARWSIRMPVFVERRRAGSGVPGDVPRVERVHVETRIAGGELTLVSRGVDTLYSAAKGMIAAAPAPPSMIVERIEIAGDSTTRAPQALPEVTTAASRIMTEFEIRRSMGGGQFLSRAQFDKAPERKFADFMASVPGARLARADGQVWVTNGRGATFTNRQPESNRRFTRGREATRACYSDVWLDGVMVYGKTADDPLFDINTMPASQIEGVEFYASAITTPARFQRNGAECGALIIWTRQRQ